jgi:hypothetical protein
MFFKKEIKKNDTEGKVYENPMNHLSEKRDIESSSFRCLTRLK